MKKIPFGMIVAHWVWTFPACLLVAIIASRIYGNDFQFSDNYFITIMFYLLAIGGVVGFILEFIIRLIKHKIMG